MDGLKPVLLGGSQGCGGVVQDESKPDTSLRDALADNGGCGGLVFCASGELEMEHALANVVGVGAGMDGKRRFDRDLGDKWSEDEGLGKIVTFPSPSIEMNAGRLPFGVIARKNFGEEMGELGRISAFHVAFGDVGIPNGMEVRGEGVVVLLRASAEITDGSAVAALVVIGGGVQGHVKVTDEMNEVAKGVCAKMGIGGGVFEDGELVGNGLGDATFRAAKLGEGSVLGGPGNVDVVPRTVLQGTANVVGPCGGIGHEVTGGVAAVTFELRVDRIL